MKKVRFNEQISIHYMIVWNFAYRESRKKYWEYFVLDRFRFQRRIKDFEKIYNDRTILRKHLLQP